MAGLEEDIRDTGRQAAHIAMPFVSQLRKLHTKHVIDNCSFRDARDVMTPAIIHMENPYFIIHVHATGST